MKIAVSGKGGVGKTTISAAIIKRFARDFHVFAVDADPDISLGSVLGIPEDRVLALEPIVEMKDLINEKLGGDGAYYSLNPKVDDVLGKYSITHGNIRFLKMGAVKKGGSACYCKENTFLNALLKSLIISSEEVVILDMGAGIEHLTRGTAQGVDGMLIVTEPSIVSVTTAKVISKLAREIGVKNVFFVANKIRKEEEVNFLKSNLQGEKLIGSIPFSEEVLDMAMGIKGADDVPALNAGIENIYQELLKIIKK
ncbi:MAG: carbon monoxide dehydrogenase [Gracilibacter sp. BRH_c7a]|nr:MAG: carbon monoxide dehydrogenase [Gracilibacter sp. BRH_c7a]